MAATENNAGEIVEAVAEVNGQTTVTAAENAAEAAPKKRPGRKKKTETVVQAEAAPAPEPKKRPGRRKKTEEPAAVETVLAPETEAAPKKRPGRKKKAEVSVVLQYAGKQINTESVVAAAMESFQKTHGDVTVQTIEVYVKPEENVAYFVVNGEGSDDYKVNL